MKNLFVILTLVASLIVLGTSNLMAGPPPPPPPPLAIPVDGGAAAILIIGAAYGAKKIYDRRKAAQNTEI